MHSITRHRLRCLLYILINLTLFPLFILYFKNAIFEVYSGAMTAYYQQLYTIVHQDVDFTEETLIRTSFNKATTINPISWDHLNIPNVSYFSGMNAPNNITRWNLALKQANNNEQILIQKIMKTIKTRFEFIEYDPTLKWMHHLADYFIDNNDFRLEKKPGFNKRNRAPIVQFGHHMFEQSEEYEGPIQSTHKMNYVDIIERFYSTPLQATNNISRPIVAIICHNTGNENDWYTLSNASRLQDLLSPILNDNNVLALFLTQILYPIKHPKVIHIPFGVTNSKRLWTILAEIRRRHIPRRDFSLLIHNMASYAEARSLGRKFLIIKNNDDNAYKIGLYKRFALAKVVIPFPGHTLETSILWDILASGAVAVIKNNIGLEKIFYKLPVFLYNDLDSLTESVLQQVYVEALYHADSWDYRRITRRWFQQLIFRISESSNIIVNELDIL